jgi:hypothetical protein
MAISPLCRADLAIRSPASDPVLDLDRPSAGAPFVAGSNPAGRLDGADGD